MNCALQRFWYLLTELYLVDDNLSGRILSKLGLLSMLVTFYFSIVPIRVMNVLQPQLTQHGLHKVPKASDLHGCVYSGLGDLLLLDRAHLTSFVKKGCVALQQALE